MAGTKGAELVQFITEQVVTYIDDSNNKKGQPRRQHKEPWQNRWFGLLPMALSLWFDHKNPKKSG
ncbi:MAG TPA: YqzE family protein [Bacilli bacterium]